MRAHIHHHGGQRFLILIHLPEKDSIMTCTGQIPTSFWVNICVLQRLIFNVLLSNTSTLTAVLLYFFLRWRTGRGGTSCWMKMLSATTNLTRWENMFVIWANWSLISLLTYVHVNTDYWHTLLHTLANTHLRRLYSRVKVKEELENERTVCLWVCVCRLVFPSGRYVSQPFSLWSLHAAACVLNTSSYDPCVDR